MTYLTYETRTEDLLAELDNFEAATTGAELLADRTARDIEWQPAANGGGRPGGISVTLEVHDADTGAAYADITVCSNPVPPRCPAGP